jgi:type IV pilus assembly protein PilZ
LGPGPSGNERRREARYDVRLEVDYQAEDTFVFAHITDISSMGIFIATDKPRPIGSRIALRFTPGKLQGSGDPRPPANAPPIEVLGDVVWTTEKDGKGGHAGMGIKFADLEAASRSRILDLVRAVAYLDGSS